MKVYDHDGNIAQRRPTEVYSPVVIAVAGLIAKLLDVTDADTLIYMMVVLGFVPAAVTWLVTLVRK